MKACKFFYQNQEGSAIVLVSLAMVALLAMVGLVIDGGSLYVTKSDLQKTANAAALSGAQELTHSKEDVERVVRETLEENRELDSLLVISIEDDRLVRVELERKMPVHFAKLFGIDDVKVYAEAAAEIATMGRAVGAAPLGIDESIELIYGKEYKLKVDEEDVDTGNFGVLALGGSGASTYEENLKHGYQDEIKIGQILETQTGNVTGKTRDGVQERINASTYPVGETYHRDDPRVLLIPVYTPYKHDQNQLKEVKITGFAYFYISEPMDQHDKTIAGQFIRRTGTGFNEGSTENTGAYSIRLTQ